MKDNMMHICMISDDNYVMPTCVAIQSLLECKKSDYIYNIHIVASALSEETEQQFKRFESDIAHIDIVRENAEERFKGYHIFDDNAICVASISALLKFVIADLFLDVEKILYLDGDLIVKKDLKELYDYDLQNYYAAAVIDSGSIYYKHEYVKKVKNYFNSGVMLLNLAKIREDRMVSKLLTTKKELNDTSLMDQNVFNLVFNQNVLFLPIKYNFMPVSLERSYSKWNIEQVNEVYGTNYENKKALFNDSVIIHYSSKDKPWKIMDGACADEWISVYLKTPIEHNLFINDQQDIESCGISVIMPCYNVENYVRQTLASIFDQTFRNYEIVCLDDGSTDDTLNILKEFAEIDDRIKVYSNTNNGQGYERNLGINYAKGKYIYFMDSDDLLHKDCFKRIFKCAEENRLDLLYFEGTSFYESTELENKFPQYKYVYNRKEAYPKVYSGKELYVKLRKNGEMIVSPCLQFIRKRYLEENGIKFPELAMMEDNLFTFQTLLQADRVKCLGEVLFYRRVRANSTMTADRSLERIDALTVTLYETMKEYIKYEKDSPMYEAIASHIRGYLKNLYSTYEYMDTCLKENIFDCVSKDQMQAIVFALYMDFEEKRYRETSEKLKVAWKEKSEINRKLQITYKEKADRGLEIKRLKEENEKLKAVWKEKSEINKKLQITYKEKADRGLEIKRLKEELNKEKNSCSLVKVLKNIVKRIIRKVLRRI